MRRLPGFSAHAVALVAAVAAIWLFVSLLAGRRQDLLGVAMAMLCVLCGTIAAVATAAARQRAAEDPGDTEPAVEAADTEPRGVDAATLESLGDSEAVRALRERYRDHDAGR